MRAVRRVVVPRGGAAGEALRAMCARAGEAESRPGGAVECGASEERVREASS